MATLIWDGSTDGDWNTAANWDTGAVPVDGDDVIFNGADNTQNITSVLTTQGAIDLASLTILASFTKDIGTAAAPLEIEISGDLLIEGTGNYYIQSGSLNATTDGAIDRTIINTSGNVFLSSQVNDGSNQTVFTTVIVNSGTVLVYGAVEAAAKATHPAEGGTVIDTLILAPSNGAGSGVTVTIGEDAFRTEGTVYTDIIMDGGTLITHSSMRTVTQSGGTLTHGGTLYTLGATDDTVTTLNLHGGKFKWRPSVVSTPGASGVRTTATAAPVITTANIYGGVFNASDMLELITTAPTITTAYLSPGATLNLDNNFAQFIVTTFKDYGGNVIKSPGQAITYT